MMPVYTGAAPPFNRQPDIRLMDTAQYRLIGIPDDRRILAVVPEQSQTLPTDVTVAMKHGDVSSRGPESVFPSLRSPIDDDLLGLSFR